MLRTTFPRRLFRTSSAGPARRSPVTSDFEGSRTFKDFKSARLDQLAAQCQPQCLFHLFAGLQGRGLRPARRDHGVPETLPEGACSQQEVFDFMSFEPETVDSFELGWKASLLDNRLNI